MTTPLRFLQLTAAEDAALRTLERSDGIQAKVRLRASIIRLNAAGMSVPRLVEHFQRNPQSIHNDLDRYETRGVAGLADGRSPGPPPRLTPAMEVYVQERLAEPRLWNSALLSEALQERFEVTVSRDAMRVRLRALGYSWKRGRYAPGQTPDPVVVHEHRASIETLKKGALDGKLTLKFLDQTGFSLMLSVCKSWFPRGSGQQFKVPTRWGSQGRINLIGTLALNAQGEHLEVRELTASCTQDTVIAYVDTLAEQADAEQRRLGKKRLTVIVLDNASFHRGQAIRDRLPVWAAKGLLLRYLPPYCPMLNRIETTWRILKGFLMPRRCYDTVAQLRAALLTALAALGATII